MHPRSREARQIVAEGMVLARFLDHLGPDITPHERALAERAARSVVAVARLEDEATRRNLTPRELDDLFSRSKMLGVVLRKLGTEAPLRREQ